MRARKLVLAAATTALLTVAVVTAAIPSPNAEATVQALALVSRLPQKQLDAIAWFRAQKRRDTIPALILALRFNRQNGPEIIEALSEIAGERAGDSWNAWMLWQEKQKDIKPFAGFDAFKSAVMASVDPAFMTFLYPGMKHEIRLEEIAWGGVVKDGIPALTNPKLVAADDKAASYLTDSELVFGVSINGDARAYPLRILDWHEMFNDVIGGVPVSLAYCTLCGSGILFETRVEGRDKPFVFGSSGFLYRSNKLMYDTETSSLWNQFTGRPVTGELTGSGIALRTRPVVIARWGDWLKANPETKVLSLDTGYTRDYVPGRPYGSYFSSPDLMFPVNVDESKLKAKDYVFALRGTGHEKAWPLALFEKKPVINDSAGVLALTLVGDAASRSVRAYRTQGEKFEPGANPGTLMHDGKAWRVTEDALVGPGGKSFTRLPGHVAFWFAWSGYLGGDGEVAQAAD